MERFNSAIDATKVLTNRGIKVDTDTKVIAVKTSPGIDTWGAIDYLVNYWKYRWIVAD